MNFLGLGPGELFLILLLALIVFGPAKLPEIGGGIGRAIAEFRRTSTQITEEFNRTLQLETQSRQPRRDAELPAQESNSTVDVTGQAAAPVVEQQSSVVEPIEPVSSEVPSDDEIQKLEADLERRRLAAVAEIRRLEAELEKKRLALGEPEAPVSEMEPRATAGEGTPEEPERVEGRAAPLDGSREA